MSDLHHHQHSHHHTHSHSAENSKNYSSAFAIGTILNLGFVIAEATYGITSHSLSLIADAGHNLSDVLGLLLAWGATALASRMPTKSHTYGYRSSSILAALFNALLLLVAIGAIAWESIRRLQSPEVPQSSTMIWVAIIGIVINSATALLFMSGRKHDLNLRGTYVHMLGDAAVSVGVVIAGLAIQKTNWLWIDPAVSLLIVIVIFYSTWGLLRDSVNLALNAVPEGIDVDEVKKYLQDLSQVQEVHDLHIWGMSTTEVALTVHLVLSKAVIDDELLACVAAELKSKFKISHSTIQLETKKLDCKLAPENVV